MSRRDELMAAAIAPRAKWDEASGLYLWKLRRGREVRAERFAGTGVPQPRTKTPAPGSDVRQWAAAFPGWDPVVV